MQTKELSQVEGYSMDQDHGSHQDEAKKSARVVAALPPTSSSPSISSLLSKAEDLTSRVIIPSPVKPWRRNEGRLNKINLEIYSVLGDINNSEFVRGLREVHG
jgi:hypothetical protein